MKEKKYITLNEAKYKTELEIGEKKKKDREAQKAKLKETNPDDSNLILDESIQILLDNL